MGVAAVVVPGVVDELVRAGGAALACSGSVVPTRLACADRGEDEFDRDGARSFGCWLLDRGRSCRRTVCRAVVPGVRNHDAVGVAGVRSGNGASKEHDDELRGADEEQQGQQGSARAVRRRGASQVADPVDSPAGSCGSKFDPQADRFHFFASGWHVESDRDCDRRSVGGGVECRRLDDSAAFEGALPEVNVDLVVVCLSAEKRRNELGRRGDGGTLALEGRSRCCCLAAPTRLGDLGSAGGACVENTDAGGLPVVACAVTSVDGRSLVVALWLQPAVMANRMNAAAEDSWHARLFASGRLRPLL